MKGARLFIVGIDEAGRGPLAGPMIIAAVAGLPRVALWGIRDSKKLTCHAREQWFCFLKRNAICRYVWVPAAQIDREGISVSSRKAVARLLRSFSFRPHEVLLDGSLYAPKGYRQRTIIKGDEKVPLIAAASVIAKVTRDRKMQRLHKEYPQYGFAVHKGYGTVAHIAAIRRYGLSKIHRQSFCTRFVKSTN